MSELSIYFGIGIDHILSTVGLDHILFIVALTAVYQFGHWKHLLILITAFTVGHSVTLILATLKWIIVPTKWVEFLIPVTILVTALQTILWRSQTTKNHWLHYAIVVFFGFIHGMGFSASLSAMLGSRSLIIPLLGFNLGLELGQIVIVVAALIVSFIFVSIFRVKPRDWTLIVSSIIVGAALMIVKERIFW